MITATVIITVRYAPDATMEEAEDDKAEFSHRIQRQFLSSVADVKDIHVDHCIAEVSGPTDKAP